MEIPKYIQDSIIKSGKHNAIAVRHNEIIREWLSKQGLDTVAWEDQIIDCLEYGNDLSSDFIKFLKSE